MAVDFLTVLAWLCSKVWQGCCVDGKEKAQRFNVYYITTYAQISSVNYIKITPTCFAVNTPSSDSLQLC